MTNDLGQAGPRNPAFDTVADLIARGLSGPLSEADAAELDNLIATTPNAGAFAEALVEQWTLAGIAGDPYQDRQSRQQRAGAVDNLSTEEASLPVRHRWHSMRGRAAAAAALLAVAGGGLTYHMVMQKDRRPVLIAATNEPMTTSLSDGSKVSLSRDGKVLVELRSHQRLLRQIGGEAYYEVAKDHHRPFTVEASGYRVTALGTRFNVAPDPSGLKVDLLAGRLRIETDRGTDKPVFLDAGQSFVGGVHPKVMAANPAAADWRTGRLVFNDEALAQVAQRLARYSGKRVGIRSDAVGQIRFSGVLRWDAPDDWSAAFEATLPVRVEQAPDGIEIVARAG
jgi:transmembrane sensor